MSSPLFPADPLSARIVQVSEFVLQLRQQVEQSSPLGWVSGEISNLVRASSGHLYFILKDERAQIRCAMWRNRAQLLRFRPEEGQRVELRAQATVYEARGDLQLSVETIRPAGPGGLFEAYLRLKAALEAEGLFAAERKRPLPRLPRALGIITSPAAAALQDVLASLRRRAPALPLVLYPCPVQGEGAGQMLARTLALASERAEADGIDALILCRGGGSIEDLWAFNHEALARALAACRVPVVCGVGHETDTTLADFAADLRAATPTAAAELASAGWHTAAQRLPVLANSLQLTLEQGLRRRWQRVDELQRRLLHPRARLALSRERLSRLAQRLNRATRQQVQQRQWQLRVLAPRLRQAAPDAAPVRTRLAALQGALQSSLQRSLQTRRQQLDKHAGQLASLNPAAVLRRGYAVVRDSHGAIVRDAASQPPGSRLQLQLASGELPVRVISAAETDDCL